MAEGGEQDGFSVQSEGVELEDIEFQIQSAMKSRVSYFEEQADSLTFEGVRRLLEKDLGLETYTLDVHKRFIKQCLFECLGGANDGKVSKNSEETMEKKVSPVKVDVVESPEKHQAKKNVKEPSSEDDEKMEDSPVMGLLTGHKTIGSEAEETQGTKKKDVPSESIVTKAIRKRATYFRENSDKITMAGVRLLLEEDLGLAKSTLYPFKKLISEQLDEVLKRGVKKNSSEKKSHSKASESICSEGSSDASDSESKDIEDIKSEKKVAPKGKNQKPEAPRKRKRPTEETKMPGKKQSKPAETTSEENSDVEDHGNVSEDGQSQLSVEKSAKKKELSAPTYGKQVEHLKSVIKSCGMSIPPSVYKRAKQAPENKREAVLTKELEEILSREGLSTNPTEKEIKDVRKKKERAKELEGIDMSNIVSSSRRRSTTSFVAPPKPQVPVESSDDDNAEDSNSNDEDGDDEGEDDEEDENDADDGDDSQSEEFNEDDDDDSD